MVLFEQVDGISYGTSTAVFKIRLSRKMLFLVQNLDIPFSDSKKKKEPKKRVVLSLEEQKIQEVGGCLSTHVSFPDPPLKGLGMRLSLCHILPY